MRIVVWRDGPPPLGFELGEPPTDFGIASSAYKWRAPKSGERSTFADGRILCGSMQRGDRMIVRADGSIVRLDTSAPWQGEALLDLLREAARDGVEGEL